MTNVNPKRVDLLRAKRAQIDAQIVQLAARERAGDRKADTRRKILIGAVIMQEMEARPDEIGSYVISLLKTRLTKPRDRALFDLPPLNQEPGATTAGNSTP